MLLNIYSHIVNVVKRMVCYNVTILEKQTMRYFKMKTYNDILKHNDIITESNAYIGNV